MVHDNLYFRTNLGKKTSLARECSTNQLNWFS
uniref:Uncharacterized protein n=1 Tax=Arundo donax TaxID=35708 RepID=A0A0A9FZN4_ARUDO